MGGGDRARSKKQEQTRNGVVRRIGGGGGGDRARSKKQKETRNGVVRRIGEGGRPKTNRNGVVRRTLNGLKRAQEEFCVRSYTVEGIPNDSHTCLAVC